MYGLSEPAIFFDRALSIYKRFENDARELLLTDAHHDFRDRARYWRGDGDASNCFSKEIAGIALSA